MAEACVAMFFLILASALGWYIADLTARSPDIASLTDYRPAEMTRIHAGDGRLIAEYAAERRLRLDGDEIPDLVKQAFISAEDGRFHQHEGVDYRGLAAAIGRNVMALATDAPLIGGSTITQQVVKNTLLSSARTVDRKVTEALLAWRLEDALPKEDILEIYLNEVYLGLGAHGVAVASETYFGKPVVALTLPEAAYLAALPKAPNNYHYRRYPERAIDRRNWVIDRMVDNGFVEPDRAAAAKEAPLGVRETGHEADRSEDIAVASYFAADVRRRLIDAFGEDGVYRGGLTVHTSLDPDLQDRARRALRKGLADYDRARGWRGPVATVEEPGGAWEAKLAAYTPPSDLPGWRVAVVLETGDGGATVGVKPIGAEEPVTARLRREDVIWARRLSVGDVIHVEKEPANGDAAEDAPPTFALRQVPEVGGALVALDPHTGRVLAMAGGFSFAESPFNRASQALRQPGSSFKPFVYATALESGYTPSSVVLDAPIAVDQGPDQAAWRPKNYSGNFLGPATLRTGIERSRNVMTVRLAQQLGTGLIADYVRRFGLYDEVRAVPSLALGAGETSLLRLAGAYATFANGGYAVTPRLIDRVEDASGRTTHGDGRACPECGTAALPGARVLQPSTAYQIVSMLEGVVQRGTATVVRDLGRPVAGKTGTTNESRDVWFIGFTPDLLAGVFIGYDQPRTLGARATGGGLAAPVFLDFMRRAVAGTEPAPFPVPPDVHLQWVNRRTGMAAPPHAPGAMLEVFKSGTAAPTAWPEMLQAYAVPGYGQELGPPVQNATPSGSIEYSYRPGSKVGTYTINGRTFTYERD